MSATIAGVGLFAGVLLVTHAALAQQPHGSASASVVTCASLANLRAVLRKSEGDPAAVAALIKDTRADLGCAMLDPAAVTGLADHVALNGQAYDCLALQHTSICHWVVAGAVKPPAPVAPKPRR